MALTTCKECGKEISNKANKCPECGAPQTSKRLGCLTLIALILFGGYVVSYFNPNSSTDLGIKSSSTTTPERPSLATPSSPPLEVQSWRCEKEYGYVYVRGEVKNNSNSNLENIMVVGEFRTKDGTLVKTESALLEYNPILPGQVSPFRAGGTDNPELTKCGIGFKYLFGGEIAYTTAEDKKKAQREMIEEAQRLLTKLGYNPGKPDGIMGPSTKKAIIKYQKENGLPTDGKVTTGLLDHLNRQSE